MQGERRYWVEVFQKIIVTDFFSNIETAVSAKLSVPVTYTHCQGELNFSLYRVFCL